MATTDTPMPFCPAKVGDKLEDVDTPALCVDLELVEANIDRVSSSVSDRVSVRPHFKAHKCSALAKFQMARHTSSGVTCVGMCAQKVCEAEALVAAGVRNVYVANQVVGKSKIARLVALAADPANTVSVVIDSAVNAANLAEAAGEAGIVLGVLVEMDVGQHRCGVNTPEDAVELVQEVLKLPALKFLGLHCYQGLAQHIRSEEERERVVGEVADLSRRAAELVRAIPVECPLVTGGGTGTFALDAKAGVLNEVQPGSYVVYDRDYSDNLVSDGERDGGRVWRPSLFAWTTVMSVNPAQRRGVLDAGLKCMTAESGPPVLLGAPDLQVDGLADEHTTFSLREGVADAALPALGAKLRLQPGHCDPTCNLHDWIVAVRGGVVEHVWRVDGRGPGF